jgi:hypothetical protein
MEGEAKKLDSELQIEERNDYWHAVFVTFDLPSSIAPDRAEKASADPATGHEALVNLATWSRSSASDSSRKSSPTSRRGAGDIETAAGAYVCRHARSEDVASELGTSRSPVVPATTTRGEFRHPRHHPRNDPCGDPDDLRRQ